MYISTLIIFTFSFAKNQTWLLILIPRLYEFSVTNWWLYQVDTRPNIVPYVMGTLMPFLCIFEAKTIFRRFFFFAKSGDTADMRRISNGQHLALAVVGFNAINLTRNSNLSAYLWYISLHSQCSLHWICRLSKIWLELSEYRNKLLNRRGSSGIISSIMPQKVLNWLAL